VIFQQFALWLLKLVSEILGGGPQKTLLSRRRETQNLKTGENSTKLGESIVSTPKTIYNPCMLKKRIPLLILTTSLVAFVAGCSGGAPYIHQGSEFNRESDAYRNGITDRTGVTICYSSRATSPETISKMARDECARFGKSAVFLKQSYQTCPLVTPSAAVYDCKKAEPNAYSLIYKSSP